MGAIQAIYAQPAIVIRDIALWMVGHVKRTQRCGFLCEQSCNLMLMLIRSPEGQRGNR